MSRHFDSVTGKKIVEEVERRVAERLREIEENPNSDKEDYQRLLERIGHPASLPDCNPNPVIEIDARGEITYCNQAAEETFRQLEIDCRDGATLLAGNADSLCKTDGAENLVSRHEVRIKDRFFTVSCQVIGSPGVIRIFAQDVTEHRLMEEERGLLNTIMAATDVMLAYLDTEFNFILVNPAYAETCKKQPAEIIGRNLFTLYPHAENEAIFRRVRDTGEPVFYKDTPFTFPDQPERGLTYWDWSLVPVKNTEGRVAGLVLSLRETTRYKHSELALADSEKRFRTLAEATFEGIAIIEEGRFVDANEQLLKIYGCDRQDLVGRAVEEFLLPEDRNRVLSNIFAGRESHVEHDMIRKDGSRVTVEAHGQTILSDGKPVRFTVVRDITERKLAEEERRKVQRIESLGLLAGGIAHDFNNILMVILGSIERAKTFLPLEKRAFEKLATAEEAVIQARGITQQLLTFSKGGAPIKKITSVPPLVRESVEFALRGSNVIGKFSFPKSLWLVEVDANQMQQVINNLAINACQAMPKGGSLRISARNETLHPKNPFDLEEGEYVRIDLTDQGTGIMRKDLDKIFDPYFTTKESGSGLGLAISYSVIKRHGGAITADSTPGRGSTFSILLPASKQKGIPNETRERKGTISVRGLILVMDDEETVNEIAAELLQHLGYEVKTVKDGATAVAAYKDALKTGDSFSAVIADLTVPGGMGGKETVRRLLEIDPQAKVIVSSGYANDPIMSDYADYGFKGVIPKPYTLAELSEALSAVR
jgi:two-component system cell cycle sensor histidine kinase/response regulator CckA